MSNKSLGHVCFYERHQVSIFLVYIYFYFFVYIKLRVRRVFFYINSEDAYVPYLPLFNVEKLSMEHNESEFSSWNDGRLKNDTVVFLSNDSIYSVSKLSIKEIYSYLFKWPDINHSDLLVGYGSDRSQDKLFVGNYEVAQNICSRIFFLDKEVRLGEIILRAEKQLDFLCADSPSCTLSKSYKQFLIKLLERKFGKESLSGSTLAEILKDSKVRRKANAVITEHLVTVTCLPFVKSF